MITLLAAMVLCLQETVNDRIVSAFVSRHMNPLETWLGHTGIEPLSLTEERWYSLSIEPENRVRCPVVYVKFRLFYARDHEVYHPATADEPYIYEEGPMEYAARVVGRVRMDLREKVLLAFTQEFLDPMETLTYGRAVFYRLPTEYSDPVKAKKEDVILKD